MATDQESKVKDAGTTEVERRLRGRFTDVEAYRYNQFSIRIRVVDTAFDGQSNPEREAVVLPLLRDLPKDVDEDITLLLLLTPEEVGRSPISFEFDHPGSAIA